MSWDFYGHPIELTFDTVLCSIFLKFLNLVLDGLQGFVLHQIGLALCPPRLQLQTLWTGVI